MPDREKHMVDVGIHDLEYPMRVASRRDPQGQPTVASISITARISHEFQAQSIHRFIEIIQRHGGAIGTGTLRINIIDYLRELNAATVTIDFSYPYFMQKAAPKSRLTNLIRYRCNYSAKATVSDDYPRLRFRIRVPVLTTDPASNPGANGGLFAQLSKVEVEVQPHNEIYPEDLVEVVDRHALCPLYPFLIEADQLEILARVHSTRRSSVVMVDAIKEELARNSSLDWYSVRCENYSMLNRYSTLLTTEKSVWIPCSCYDFEEL
ncbi:MAG: GTP cyclohydrolase, FolE2/MptA family [bacterium]